MSNIKKKHYDHEAHDTKAFCAHAHQTSLLDDCNDERRHVNHTARLSSAHQQHTATILLPHPLSGVLSFFKYSQGVQPGFRTTASSRLASKWAWNKSRQMKFTPWLTSWTQRRTLHLLGWKQERPTRH